jgi:hypothetical protein
MLVLGRNAGKARTRGFMCCETTFPPMVAIAMRSGTCAFQCDIFAIVIIAGAFPDIVIGPQAGFKRLVEPAAY